MFKNSLQFRGTGGEHSVEPFKMESIDISSISKIFAKYGLTLRIEAGLRNGIERNFKSINELLEFENSTDKEIMGLRFLSGREPSPGHVNLSFEVRRFPTRRLKVIAEGDEYDGLVSELSSLFRDMRPWYAWLARADLFRVLAAISMLISIVWTIWRLIEFIRSGTLDLFITTETPPPIASIVLVFVLALIAVVLALVTKSAEMASQWMFPRGAILVGRGIGRYELRDKVRWVIFMGIVVSIAGALVIQGATFG